MKPIPLTMVLTLLSTALMIPTMAQADGAFGIDLKAGASVQSGLFPRWMWRLSIRAARQRNEHGA